MGLPREHQSNMRGFDSYRLLTLSLAALMTRISSVVIEGAHTSTGAATLARTQCSIFTGMGVFG